MSQFVYLFRTNEAAQREHMGTPERAQQSMQAWLSWIRELEANGHLKDPGQPLEGTGSVVRGKKKVVTDGPFGEAKEQLAGFFLVDAADDERAQQVAGRVSTIVGDRVELRGTAFSDL